MEGISEGAMSIGRQVNQTMASSRIQSTVWKLTSVNSGMITYALKLQTFLFVKMYHATNERRREYLCV